MEKNLIQWILNELDEAQLLNICQEKKIKIAGFSKNKQRAPKSLIVNSLLKNRDDLISYFKKYAHNLEENNEFKNKSILEIKGLIDVTKREKMVEQIIYLSTSDLKEYTDLATETIKKAIEEKSKEEINAAIIKDCYENVKEIEKLNKIIKIQKAKLLELKKGNNELISKNQEMNNEIINIKKEYTKNEKKILLVGNRDVDGFDIPRSLRSVVDTLVDINDLLNEEYMNKYNTIWVFTFNISTQTELKLNKITTNKIRFNSILEFKNYMKKEVIM